MHMKAAVVHDFTKPLVLEEVPKPTPSDGQVVVKVLASGLCHTDIHAAHGDWPVKPKLPFIPGHEGVGYVADVGRGVKHVKVIWSLCRGSAMPVATVGTVSLAGRRCASHRFRWAIS